jgi:ribosomal protein S18 acetylase RimI-like enzyme
MEYRFIRLDGTYVDQILALQDRCWDHDQHIFVLSSRELIERMFQFENFGYGAFINDEMVGFITCSVPSHRAKMNLGRHFGFADELLDQVAHANIMAIAPEHRRRGIGSKLFNLAMNTLPGRVRYIMTTTRPENTLARQLLETRGFQHKKTINANGDRRAIYVLHKKPAD